VDPHDPVKEETVIPLDLDQEASKEYDVVSQDLMKNDSTIPPYLAQKVSWVDQEEEVESLEQLEPPTQGMLELERVEQNLSKRKKTWTTVVKKKKHSSIA